MIEHPAFAVEPWALRETELDLDAPRPERVAVRARQRPHRPARQPRRGRARRPARHLPQRLPRDPPAALRRDAPTATPRRARRVAQRHRRQAHPPAGRRRAVRRPLRRAARARARARLPRGRPAPSRCTGARPPGGEVRVDLDAHRLARPARRRGDPLRGRAGRRATSALVVQSELVANEDGQAAAHEDDDPRAAAALDGAARRRGALPARPARAARAPHAHTAACGWRPRWTTRSTARTARRRRRGRRRTSGRVTVAADVAARRDAADPQVPRLRLVGPPLAAARSAPRSAAASPRRGTPAGTGCARPSASTSTGSGSAPTSRSRATPSSSRRSASASSTCCRPAPGPSAARSPAKGLTGSGLRRPRVLGHRDLRAAGAHLHGARRRRATRCAGATARSTWPASARASSACAGAAFPWRTIAGRECSGYWPAGTAAFHVNADIADAVVRYQRGDRRRRVRARGRASTCSSRRRACGARSATTTPAGGFRIDGVTGPDEYSAIADNNVYTNLMAAAEPARRPPTPPSATREEARRARGRRRGDRPRGATPPTTMVVPYDEPPRRAPRRPTTSRTTRSGTSTRRRADEYPLLLHYPYFDLYRKQVVKQADLVLALFTCGDGFTPEEKARDFEYYEALTVRDSSLSACAQAIVAAETGPPRARLRLPRRGGARRPARPRRTTRATACTWRRWRAAGSRSSAGFGGFRDHGGTLRVRAAAARADRAAAPSGSSLPRPRASWSTSSAREATYALAAGDATRGRPPRRGRRGPPGRAR